MPFAKRVYVRLCIYLCVHQLCLYVCTCRPILIVAMETECCQCSQDSKRASLSLSLAVPCLLSPLSPLLSALLLGFLCLIRVPLSLHWQGSFTLSPSKILGKYAKHYKWFLLFAWGLSLFTSLHEFWMTRNTMLVFRFLNVSKCACALRKRLRKTRRGSSTHTYRVRIHK